ncbi:MAG TPA: hypothetical protein VK095_09520 [Beutenbergiaceae bacterium]|nr:hypothetical protein [Beutenbergiaceae bacterium]
MTLDIPRCVLAALWAADLGEQPTPAAVQVAAEVLAGDDQRSPRAEGADEASLLHRVAGAPVLALLPAPGEPAGLGPPAGPFAVEAGEALLSGPPAGAQGVLQIAVPQVQAFGSHVEPGALVDWQTWSEPTSGTAWVPPLISLSEARADLAEALNVAIEALTAIDVARWREDAAEEIAMLADNDLPEAIAGRVPPGLGTRHAQILGRAVRLQAIVALAEEDDGAAVNLWQADQRTAALRHVATAARRALMALSVSGFDGR